MVTPSSPIGRYARSRPHGRPNECPVDTYVDARAICFRSESPASSLVVGASLSALVLHAVESPESGYHKTHRFGPHIYI
ncbi:hypothetical protein M438DRAFT_345519 [Aureobasidium pullulans EXF-150]|uniref:Uncharacterized protein n=1 Tax=Aureobasidium pullulans EXF-150 TaxID=1043002 RepID=A0A074XKW8_AURPU|nr:uncharacterized protein M438DRAFT_345519 [Aureobasidium pullulans EXF-150]KEQ84384.1 hypothetical protein M438DRAFT_345519 [Aureobasidium pullulans EXF-150]